MGPAKRLTPMAASDDPHRTTTDSLRSFSPFPASDMLCAPRANHVHTFTGRTTRTRAWPERGCRVEYERDGRDWAVHRDSARHSGYGRAAMPSRMGCGSRAFLTRRACVGGTWRGNASGRRDVCVSAGNLWAWARRASDVVSLYLADAD